MNGKGKLGKEVGMDMPREADVVWITSFVHILISLKENKNIYFMGDFNLNLMDHESHHQTNEFLNIMFSNMLLPLITRLIIHISNIIHI